MCNRDGMWIRLLVKIVHNTVFLKRTETRMG